MSAANTSKTDAVSVAIVTEPALVVNHRHDAAVVLDENRLLHEPHGQRRVRASLRLLNGIEDSFEEVVNVVDDRVMLLGIVEYGVVGDGHVG